LKLLQLLLLAPAFAAAQSYVGGDACRTCHGDIWADFYKNPHYINVASGKLPPEKTGCESCHGPGSLHVASHGATPIPRAFSKMPPQEVLADCLACHSKTLSRANIRRSAHTEAGVVCNNCHSIHKSTAPRFLLAKIQRELCYGCHAEVRAQFDLPVKHRVNEGVIDCTDCHNPHGAFAPTWRNGIRPRMVDQRLFDEEPCLKCHVDKRGPFVFEHAAVRIGGCEACHTPHGSSNPQLLRRPVTYTLCLECHNGAGAFGLQNSGVPMQTALHNLLLPQFQHCTMCHVRIHGSNADANFLR